jgi:hypothetical protein
VLIAPIPDPVAVSALEDALALLPESAVSARAHAYSQLACIPPYSSTIEVSRSMSQQAMRLAQLADDPALLLEALRSRLRALSGPDSSDELLRVADEILKLDPRSASWCSADAQITRYHVLFRRGDVAAADRALAAFGQIGRELRVREWVWHHDRLRAQRLLQAGRLDQAQREFDELWARSQRLRLPYAAIFYGAQLSALNVERNGRRLTAEATHTRHEAWKWARHMPAWRTERVLVLLETGDHVQARREFRALAEHGFAAVTRDSSCLFVFAKLSIAAVILQDHSAARDLHAALEPYANLIALSDFSFSLGCVSHFLGMLARFLTRRAQAREYFEVALDTNTRVGDELQALRSRLALAHLLGESRSRRDQARAEALIAEVSALAEPCGAYSLHGAAASLRERLFAHSPRTPLSAARAGAGRSRQAKSNQGKHAR